MTFLGDFLRVCPVHFPILLTVSSVMRSCLACTHGSLVYIISGCLIFRMFHGQLLIKWCSLLDSVELTCRVSGQYGLAMSASGAEDPGFESRLRRDFSGSSHTTDLNIGTPVATLLGAWHYRVSAGTGRPGVSIL